MAKQIQVFSPEDCPFRFTEPCYDGDQEYCNEYCNLVRKGYVENDNGLDMCFCSEDGWRNGDNCPLLLDNFMVSQREK